MAYSAWSVSALEQPNTAKWNILGSNDADFNNKFTGVTAADGMNITNPIIVLKDESPTADGRFAYNRTEDELRVGDGTNSQIVRTGAWKSFTPSFTNITLGNASYSGAYCQVGKLIIGWVKLQFGSTTSITGNPTLSAPIGLAASISATALPLGKVVYEDSGTGYNTGVWTGFGGLVVDNASGTYVALPNNINATIPFTWTTNDKIYINFFYEAT